MLALLLSAVVWASAFVGTRLALRSFAPQHVALLRYLTASLVFAGIAAARRVPLPARRDLLGIGALGITGITVYNLVIAHAQVHVPAGTASMLIASAPLWMAVLGATFLGERLNAWAVLGIVASCAGVAIIALGKGRGLGLDAHALLLLGAAVAQATYFIGQKRLVARYGALPFTAYAVWAGTLALFPFGGGMIDAVRRAPWTGALAVLYLGVVPGALGYATWAYGIARTPALTAASFLYLVPAFALGIAWVVLGEVPSALSLLGGALVVGGVVVVQRLRGAPPLTLARRLASLPPWRATK